MQAITKCQEAHFPHLFLLSEPDVGYDCCFMEPYLSDTYPKGQIASEWHNKATQNLFQCMQQYVKTPINFNKHE